MNIRTDFQLRRWLSSLRRRRMAEKQPLFYTDETGAYCAQKLIVNDAQLELQLASQDLVEVGACVREHVEKLISEDSGSVSQEVLSSYLQGEVVSVFMKKQEEFNEQEEGWLCLFIKMGTIIFLNAKEANKTNQEKNCEIFADFVRLIFKEIAAMPEDKLKLLCASPEFLNYRVQIEQYLSLGILLVARYAAKPNVITFVIHSQEKRDFFQVYSKLSEIFNSIYEKLGFQLKLPDEQIFVDPYCESRRQIERLFERLGNGNIALGLKVYFDRIQGIQDPNYNQYTMQQIQEILNIVPVDTKTPQHAEEILNKLVKNQLPTNFSVQMKIFWIFHFGDVKNISWEHFCNVVFNGHQTFLYSNEVQQKLSEFNLQKDGIINYLLNYKLDRKNIDNLQITEVNDLFQWSNKFWDDEDENSRGFPPRFLGDILRVLFNHMKETKQEIEKLILQNKRINQSSIISTLQRHSLRLPQIKKLDLTKNPLKDPGAKILFENIADNKIPALQILVLDDCQLRTLDGIQRILRMLTRLSLSFNQIDDSGAQKLFFGLEKNGPIEMTEIDLSDNKITDFGAKKLIDVLATENCNVEEFNISSNKLSRQFVEEYEGFNALLEDKGMTILVDFMEGDEQQQQGQQNNNNLPVLNGNIIQNNVQVPGVKRKREE